MDHLNLEAGIFTNFSQDHLDYHRTMKAYLNAKLLLFSKLLPKKKTIITDKNIKEFPILKKISKQRKLRLIDISKISDELKKIKNINFNEFQLKNLSMAVVAAKLCKLKESKIFKSIKRIQDVINVFCKINKEIPSKLIMIGDGPERANIESLTRSLCSLRDVMFIGKIPDVETVLYKADLFLLTSEKESFGLSALEAMASSVPVISSNAGGLPELVEEGISGFTCDIGDVNSMSEKAIKVLDKKNLSGFKENALRIANNYDINIILPKYVEFYKNILNKG